MTNSRVPADNGVLVGLVNQKDRLHDWAFKTSKNLAPPFYVYAAVLLTESCFLLQHSQNQEESILGMRSAGLCKLIFACPTNQTPLAH
jgi:hypothetical protein